MPRGPDCARCCITASPCRTSARLTPVSGTTSATVPSATRSSHCRRSGSGRGVAVPAGRAQRAVDADAQQEGDADGGELLVRALVVDPVGIDHRERLGQRQLGLVMVDHDDVEPGLARLGERLVGGDAAIDRDDDRRALLASLSSAGALGP